MTSNRSAFVRAAQAVWHFVDGARKVFLNLLFLLVLYLLWTALVPSEEPLRLKSKTTLLLQPAGTVVEEYTTSPMDRALQGATGQAQAETRLRDLVEAIRYAAEDDAIAQMVIDPNAMAGIGLASLLEIEAAVGEFREAGKPVIAVADNLGQHQYYLAAMADEVWLDPRGMVWIDGYANYRNYFREGLDKLEVQVNLFRVGEYKSAMEPFIRDDMSPEAREAAIAWLDSLWRQYLEGVARFRGMPAPRLAEAIDGFAERIVASDGDFARLALDLGLVDRLVSQPAARVELARLGAATDEGGDYRHIDFLSYVERQRLLHRPGDRPRVAVVVAQGEIVPGGGDAGSIGGQSMAETIREAGRQDRVRAVVLRVDSPGGDAFASEQVRRELQALRDAGKKVVVSMGDVAASGGYWISVSADELWSSPATITGSIGVFGFVPTFERTLGRLGIHTDGVGTTPIAGRPRIDQPLGEDLRRVFQSAVEHTYDDFLDTVAEARPIDRAAVEEVARGRVWSGEQALRHGLVDRTGTLDEAIESAARLAGVDGDYEVTWSEPELSFLETLVLELTATVATRLGPVSVAAGLPPLGAFESLVDDLAVLAGQREGLTLAAHCLCGLD